MTNISLDTVKASLVATPDQLKEMTQPNGKNHCGAFALTAALAAQGVVPVKADKSIDFNSKIVKLTHEQRFFSLAHSIYSLSGILNEKPSAGHELVLADGYNSPAALAAISEQLGVAVKVHVTKEGYEILGKLYPGEKKRCEDAVGASDVHVGTDKAPVSYGELGDKEIHLVCVTSGPGLHWLARGSNGEYYDPANGTLSNKWGPPHALDFSNKSQGYTFAGLWLVLTK